MEIPEFLIQKKQEEKEEKLKKSFPSLRHKYFYYGGKLVDRQTRLIFLSYATNENPSKDISHLVEKVGEVFFEDTKDSESTPTFLKLADKWDSLSLELKLEATELINSIVSAKEEYTVILKKVIRLKEIAE